MLEDALAVYEVELDRLALARPDVIVTQDLCDVCAVSLDDVQAAIARLGLEGVAIVNLHPTRLGDVWSDIERVGAALGRADEGTARRHRARARASRRPTSARAGARAPDRAGSSSGSTR